MQWKVNTFFYQEQQIKIESILKEKIEQISIETMKNTEKLKENVYVNDD